MPGLKAVSARRIPREDPLLMAVYRNIFLGTGFRDARRRGRKSEMREHESESESESKHSILRFCEIKNKDVY